MTANEELDEQGCQGFGGSNSVAVGSGFGGSVTALRLTEKGKGGEHAFTFCHGADRTTALCYRLAMSAELPDVPDELEGFKFARQRSKLAGTIRGSYFVIKNEY